MILNIVLFIGIIILSISYILLNQKYKKLERRYTNKIQEIYSYKDIIYNEKYTDSEKVNSIRWEMENLPF